MIRRIGSRTIGFEEGPVITGFAAVAGKKESEGPLSNFFDRIIYDIYNGLDTFEDAESRMQAEAVSLALEKSGLRADEIDYIFAGDLLNQCTGSSFGLRDFGIPYLGQYGACSTMGQGLLMSAVFVESDTAKNAVCATSSHFCSAERQYRFPLEYGGVRPPSAQWTVTGAGAVILAKNGRGPRITHVTTGVITDAEIDDPNNMGAAMAPAAHATLTAHFAETGRSFADYDAVFTGDLGALGHDILQSLLEKDGFDTGVKLMDCGVLIYDRKTQGVNSGGSGCGCSASVLAGHILPAMEKGIWKRVLFAATGALMSPTSAQQGQSIPGICHAAVIENEV